ncbi:hypothetical protein RJ639_035346 [Escallonia herrerae]|uniref:Glutaredoxin-dependent peroxiredoxin n=1 Tax=Escallonia herrerae TaxID=1293975 RepID=A0AA88WR49_9ASTE|nr:hypothetical protein RJ639_035346 [Escallonia herrerae]
MNCKSVASGMLKRSTMMRSVTATFRAGAPRRSYASVAVGSDLVSAAPDVSLQKARSWDEGVSSKFSTTPLKDIFKARLFLNPRCFEPTLGFRTRIKKWSSSGYLQLGNRIFLGAFTGVCSAQHVPSYKNNIDKLKGKGVDSVICVAINDPYVMNGWAEKLQAKDAIEFYGDFNGSFHKSLDLGIDLSAALLGPRSHRWSAYVVDGNVKVLNVETAPSEFKVSGGEVILGQI